MSDLEKVQFVIQKIRLSQYVYEYKNVWDPENKRSKTLYRIPVGKIIDGQVIIKEEYLQKNPSLRQGDLVLNEAGRVCLRSALMVPARELFALKRIDHFVLTTSQPEKMLAFYETLGFQTRQDGERYVIETDGFKINLHVKGKELEPHAAVTQAGTGDFCLEIDSKISMEKLKEGLLRDGVEVCVGPIARHGAFGKMVSIYLRDPDQNLVELCQYDHQRLSSEMDT